MAKRYYYGFENSVNTHTIGSLIIANGNIGIGTTNPTSVIDVGGDVNYSENLTINNGSAFTTLVTCSNTLTLTNTVPTNVLVYGQTSNVTIGLPTTNPIGNTITVYNVGNTSGNYNTSVFVATGTSSTSGSLTRLRQGDYISTVALSDTGALPTRYKQSVVRKSGNASIGLNGSVWTERRIPNARSWRSVAWAPELGLFCAVNYNSAAFVMTSPDGVNWTERSIPNSRNWQYVTWSSELRLFCAINYGSAAFVMTSPDGITWTERAIPSTRNWQSMDWSPELGLFCAVNYGSAAVVMTSSNGITWTERAIPTSRNWSSVVWAAELGLFCAINYNSAAVVMTSSDGITWTERAIPTSRNWSNIVWSPEVGLFCAINYNSAAVVMTSSDGITWTERAIPNARNWRSICWSPELGVYCAVNESSSAVIMTSPDAITWTERAIPNNRAWYNIQWVPEFLAFCAVVNGDAVAMVSYGLHSNYVTPPSSSSMGSTASLTTNTVTYNVASYFTDTTGTGLTYSLTANPQSSASLSGTTLTVTGNYRNTSYTVTIQAINGYGRTATSSLTVNEANGAPIATTLGSTSSLTTNTVQYTLSSFFTNPTPAGASGTITYSLVSNPRSSASISSGVLSVTGNNRNTTYTVTVRATNSYGSTDSSLSVTEAAPPVPTASSMGSTGTLSPQTVQYTLSSYFTGAGLSYSLVSNPYGNAYISSGILYVPVNGRGVSYTVTVRGTNSFGSANSSLTVTETLIGLYALPSSITLSNSGATGRNGPTISQARSVQDSWASTYLNMATQGIQQWTVPRTASYDIIIAGAAGGYSLNNNGGGGRVLRATLSLTQGQILYVVVGQMGNTAPGNSGYSFTANAGGGGGATSISHSTAGSTVIAMAGGGGGAVSDNSNGIYSDGWSAPYSQYGTDAFGTTKSTGLRNGGAAWTNAESGGGGAGIDTGGSNGSYTYGTSGGGPNGGNRYTSFLGGIGRWGGGYTNSSADGGFGGGGGVGNTFLYAAGGGGGYSGGDAGSHAISSQAGGGGGSYRGTSSQFSDNGINYSNHGYVYINMLL